MGLPIDSVRDFRRELRWRWAWPSRPNERMRRVLRRRSRNARQAVRRAGGDTRAALVGWMKAWYTPADIERLLQPWPLLTMVPRQQSR